MFDLYMYVVLDTWMYSGPDCTLDFSTDWLYPPDI